MSDASTNELAGFFGGYFHQDWDLAGPTWECVVDLFIDDSRDPVYVERIAALIEDLLAGTSDDAQLEVILQRDLLCEYWPGGSGETARAWMTRVSDRLKRRHSKI